MSITLQAQTPYSTPSGSPIRNDIISSICILMQHNMDQGGLAQLVERPLCMRKVGGSIPPTSTFVFLQFILVLFSLSAICYFKDEKSKMHFR